MSNIEKPPAASRSMAVASETGSFSWWRLLTRYHWFVLIVAALGWMFDCYDQQIFTNSRSITMRDLMPQADALTQIKFGGWATSIFILGWATGGLIFGSLGDKWGRARTMALTILVYAVCTGLSGLATSWEYFALFRFLTGAGVGGEFAVGAALVAEVMPDRARAHCLGLLQALSSVGNILAAYSLGVIVPQEGFGWGWRGLYYVGAMPALIAVFVLLRLREPERWVAAKAAAVKAQTFQRFGKVSDLFGESEWRRNTLVGLGLAVAGQIGLWGVGFYTPELIDNAIPTVEVQTRPKIEAIVNANSAEARSAGLAALDAKERRKYADLLGRASRPGEKIDVAQSLSSEQRERMTVILQKAIPEDRRTMLKSKGGMIQQIAAGLGIYAFTALAARWGRRRTFMLSLTLAWGSLVLTFSTFNSPHQVWYLWPLLGFFTLAPFGGYAIYFPELFPTRLRTTGISFCYNVGRYITAFGVFMLGPLAGALNGLTSVPGFRLAAIVLSCSYLFGLLALIWAPETLNRPLPEDQKGLAH
jgi:MFS family permease